MEHEPRKTEEVSMKLYGKANEVANQIIKAFEQGTVPQALASLFIHRHVDCPAAEWSWRNRLLVALSGHYDARGYRQWQEAGRQVKKGQRAFHILAPKIVKAKEDHEELGIKKGDSLVRGFIAVAVFGLTQTEGEALSHEELDTAFIDSLPLVEVARSWGLDISLFNAEGTGKLGFYRHGERIALGVGNLATWAHELIHAADDRLGTLAKVPNSVDSEVVAELGSAVLLECLGYEAHSDRGAAYAYIRAMCAENGKNPITLCTELLDRVCSCVAYILKTGEELDKKTTESRAA